MQKLKGPFKDIIPVLIKMKKSTGYKYNNIYSYIELDEFLYKNNITKISNDIFTLAITNEQDKTLKKRRYCALENLNVVLNIMGISRIKMHSIKTEKNEKFIARILNEKEIKMLFNEIDKVAKNNNEYYVYQVLIRLLYSTGLRISEALALKMGDYDEKNGTLFINSSKNYISRYVVLSNSMKKIFEKYLQTKAKNDDYIFDISYYKVHTFFHKIIISLSLEPCRLHDLRHIFAVHSLDNNIAPMGEEKALYYLSVFMGHSNIHSTIYYLQLTEKHIKEMQKLSEKTNEYIFGGKENE